VGLILLTEGKTGLKGWSDGQQRVTKMKGAAVGQQLPSAENHVPLSDPQFDFAPVQLRKSYIIAATPRCGSNLLCTLMYQTGVLGAPAEYWNYIKAHSPKPRKIGTAMMERLGATSAADYLTKLAACRTSKNGVFGVKLHFRRFEQALRGLPQMLDMIAPVSWIHIVRQDMVAQAVSLAKGLQTGVFTSWRQSKMQQMSPVTYDRDLIARCLEKLEAQNEAWRRWFEANNIEPHIVYYEKLAADNAGTLARVVEFLGVQNDEPDKVIPRTIERQGDSTNKEWVARFRRELESSVQHSDATVRHDRPLVLVRGTETAKAEPAVPELDSHRFADKRRRDRRDVIITGNRELLRNARVLDIQCGRGEWSVAALNAGAIHVVGLEARRRPIEMASRNLAARGVAVGSYQFLKAKIPSELESFSPGSFDVIICQNFGGLPDPHYFFEQLHRLQPRNVILDTAIKASRKHAAAFFKLALFRLGSANAPAAKAANRRFASVVAVPNPELIKLLCEHFGFGWRAIDWHTVGITNWAGLNDYQDDRRQTYVLSRI
jgi:LPS sulfotransferase NodH/2-polyprenyl-3-methyl-5-hydroxy-6-metoxy-1,4-benzoquinol methylase